MAGQNASPKMLAFMSDLADVLDKHEATIDAELAHFPYEDSPRAVIELYSSRSPYYETETFELTPGMLRDIIEKHS